MYDKLKVFAPVLSVVLVLSCTAISLSGYKAPVYAAENTGKVTAEKEAVEEHIAQGAFDLEDGIYKGTGTGFSGDIIVAVQIKDKKIVAIDILSESDDDAFFKRASAVIDKIIKVQSLDVDTVSGATYSSRGIINAVKNALTGEKDSGKTGKSQSGRSTAGSSKTAGIIEEPVAYKDGTYYGSGTGFEGTIRVKVVISGGKITSIQIIESYDGSSYIQKASGLIGSIIASQSTNVDTVSGATYSSVGIIEAVRDALRQAAATEEAANAEITEPKEVDMSNLEAAIAAAEALRAEEYTEESWANVQARLQEAKAALAAETPDIVDRAADNLNQAIHELVKNEDADIVQTVYIDGIYKATVLCLPDEDEDFEPYNLSLEITVRNNKIVSVTEVKGDGDPENDSYIKRAANGTSAVTGVVPQIINKGSADGIDTVSRATCSSKAMIEACQKALEKAKCPAETENGV